MFAAKNRNREKLGAMKDLPTYSIPYREVKKIVN